MVLFHLHVTVRGVASFVAFGSNRIVPGLENLRNKYCYNFFYRYVHNNVAYLLASHWRFISHTECLLESFLSSNIT